MDNENEKLKQAFSKVRQDIEQLREQLFELYQELQEIKQAITGQIIPTNNQTIPAHNIQNQTNQQIIPAHPTQNPAHNLPLYALKPLNSGISIGNQGVPTDRQTDQQTDRHIQITQIPAQNQQETTQKTDKLANLEQISRILESLDSLKKEVRFKFKRLTNQEMLIFSTIYQLEEQGLLVDYSLLASKLDLSESSVRDYIQKLIKKGIPLEKLKENNKKVRININQDLKKIASLEVIHKLREL